MSIAGSDSGGGAGIQADLKTFSALGCYGMTAVTAITAQNTVGVRAIHGIPPDVLKAQIEAVVEDIGVDAVKIGMLHSPELVQVVAWAIDRYSLKNVVLDPVMVATSGDTLVGQNTVQVLVRELFPRAMVVTPNLDEVRCCSNAASHKLPTLKLPPATCWRWAPKPCCSRAVTWRATTWLTCWRSPAARTFAFNRGALKAAMCMEPAARCRRRSPRTWRWATSFKVPSDSHGRIFCRPLRPVRRCTPGEVPGR